MENPAPVPPSVIRFGVFEADVRAGELRKSGARIRMQEQPFQILLMLLERPTQVVTRDEIRRKLWSGDVFVDFEHGVNSAVARLRDALGDSADSPRYIETLPRRGYRFIAPVDVTVVESPKKTNGHDNGSASSNVEESASLALLPLAPDIRSTQPLPTSPVARRRPFRLWAAALIIFLAMVLFGVHLASRPPHRLRQTDSVVLADFVNSTSDPVFDSTLRQALAVKLGESPFLSIVAEQRMRDTLRFMGRSPDQRITSITGREICQRLGSKATLSGQISQIADHYFIQLEATNCATGDPIAQAGAEAASKAATLKALDTATAEIRGKLGESLGSIQKYDAPIEQATTTSLEALKAYSLAQVQRNRGDEQAAIPLLQRAIELDPNFAMAYAVLGQVYANTGQNDLAAEDTRKAFLNGNKVGDQEKFYISTHYYDNVTHEFDKSIQTYELWQETYPRDVIPRINLNEFYGRRGEYDKALQEILWAQQIEPNRANVYEALMGDYVCLDRLGDAKAAYAQSLARGFNGEGLQLKRYVVAFLENDTLTMQQLTNASVGQRQEDIFDVLNAQTSAYFGQLHSSEDFIRRARGIASRGGFHESGFGWLAIAALNEAEFGRQTQAPRLLPPPSPRKRITMPRSSRR
jgi:DNA-binding winged helix-turn-helix (wHTH) protein/tetratricopeptide (TPR) repeat protein